MKQQVVVYEKPPWTHYSSLSLRASLASGEVAHKPLAGLLSQGDSVGLCRTSPLQREF